MKCEELKHQIKPNKKKNHSENQHDIYLIFPHTQNVYRFILLTYYRNRRTHAIHCVLFVDNIIEVYT